MSYCFFGFVSRTLLSFYLLASENVSRMLSPPQGQLVYMDIYFKHISGFVILPYQCCEY